VQVGGNFTNYGTTGALEDGGFDQISGTMSSDSNPKLPLAARPDVIVFCTPSLENGVEVTGVVTCHLWLSSSAVDTDFTVKLIDEYPPNEDYPNGYALNLSDSILRMRYREGFEAAVFMELGEVYQIRLQRPAISNFFAPDHRILVDISSRNIPHYGVNPNTGEPLGLSRCTAVARQALYQDATRASCVDLPIKPRRSAIFQWATRIRLLMNISFSRALAKPPPVQHTPTVHRATSCAACGAAGSRRNRLTPNAWSYGCPSRRDRRHAIDAGRHFPAELRACIGT
jgi:X-Pro dipeptidyl-peptidase C-terminal non-catalytic domain